MNGRFDVVILGLSVTSSWGNGHATTYRGLLRGLAAAGYRVLFLERDVPWYRDNRDDAQPEGAVTMLYETFEELVERFERAVSQASLVIVGSFVPEGVKVGGWVTSVARGVTAFYDIDTPVTLAKLAKNDYEYITPELIPRYHLYLSFTGGPTLRAIERRYGSPMARVMYCSVDPEKYRPRRRAYRWDLGYLGTYSDDRQPGLEALMLRPAREWSCGRFAVVGPLYPEEIRWPVNVEREAHLAPREHPGFYGAQRFTLNLTRAAMKNAGYSPSVRLFEAGACGTPIISDWWEGLDTVFAPGREVLVAEDADQTLRYLRELPDAARRELGAAARRRVLAEHTPQRRAAQLVEYWKEANDNLVAHTPRRNGRGRQIDHGLEPRMVVERNGQTAGDGTGRKTVAGLDPGGVHQPAGARH